MVKLEFQQISPYSFTGGSVEGLARLEVDKPTKVRDLTLSFVGREFGRMPSGQRQNQELYQEAVFLQSSQSLRDALRFEDTQHVAPGTYDLPFKFQVPPQSPPSMGTVPLPEDFGHTAALRQGMFVEYLLTLRADIPMWVDPLRRHRVWVYPTDRTLGAFPSVSTTGSPEKVGFQLGPSDPSAPLVVPGRGTTIAYRVQNPGGKSLKGLSARLVRHVAYTISGYDRTDTQVLGNFEWPLEGRETSCQGTLTIVPENSPAMVNSGEGQLYRVLWDLEFELGVHLGENAKLVARLQPGAPAPTAGAPFATSGPPGSLPGWVPPPPS